MLTNIQGEDMNNNASGRTFFSAILLILSITLFACQGGDSPPEAIHSCQIFSDSEVDALFDPTVERPFKENHKGK